MATEVEEFMADNAEVEVLMADDADVNKKVGTSFAVFKNFSYISTNQTFLQQVNILNK